MESRGDACDICMHHECRACANVKNKNLTNYGRSETSSFVLVRCVLYATPALDHHPLFCSAAPKRYVRRRDAFIQTIAIAKRMVVSAPRIELGTFRLQLQLQSNVINQLHQAESYDLEVVLGLVMEIWKVIDNILQAQKLKQAASVLEASAKSISLHHF
jgi:hypothetical protein